MTRRLHSPEFKVKAVRRVAEKGLSVTPVARDLGIARSLLTKWKLELTADPDHAFPGKAGLEPMEADLQRLRFPSPGASAETSGGSLGGGPSGVRPPGVAHRPGRFRRAAAPALRPTRRPSSTFKDCGGS